MSDCNNFSPKGFTQIVLEERGMGYFKKMTIFLYAIFCWFFDKRWLVLSLLFECMDLRFNWNSPSIIWPKPFDINLELILILSLNFRWNKFCFFERRLKQKFGRTILSSDFYLSRKSQVTQVQSSVNDINHQASETLRMVEGPDVSLRIR